MADTDLLQMRPIGYMHSVFQYKNGTPRQPSLCSTARGSLTVEKDIFNNPEHALEGLEQFSHAWIVFLFHKNKPGHSKAKVKPPRLNGKRVGVFSTRSPYRPNAIGLTLAKIEKITGSTVHFSGIDIVDGTPVVDLKPFIPQYDNPSCRDEHFTVSMLDLDCDGVSDTGAEAQCQTDVMGYSWERRLSDTHKEPIQTGCHSQGGCETAGQTTNVSRETTQNLELYSALATPVPHDLPVKLCSTPEADNERSVGVVKNKDVHRSNSVSLVNSAVPNGNCQTEAAQAGGAFSSREKNLGDRDKATSDVIPPDMCSLAAAAKQESENNATKLKLDVSYQGNVDNSPKSTGYSQDKSVSVAVSNASVASWLTAPPVTKLQISFTPKAEEQLLRFVPKSTSAGAESPYKLDFLSGASEIRSAVVSVLCEDPRSVYRREKCQDSLYFFTVDQVHVTCWFDGDCAEVVRLQPVSLVQKLTSNLQT